MRIEPSLNIRKSVVRRDAASARRSRTSPVCISALEPRILLATISGTSYADFNANGIHDAGEPALAGWIVFIDANQNLKLDAGEVSTVTNASGVYSFSSVAVGNQLIVEIPKAGWTQTGPSASDSAAPDTAAPDAALSADSPFPDAPFVGPPALHKVVSKSIPTDPMFAQQWNLRNTGQVGGIAGSDPNFITAWNTTLGQNVRIGIVDDGVDYLHPDLSAGYDAAYSWDFDENNADPAPVYGDQFNGDNHGTAVAGIALARANNGIGISGAAPGARWSAIRLVGANAAGVETPTTDAMEASALGWKNNNIDIYNNSWGPEDDGNILLGPGALARAAIQNAITAGRAGKGNIYVWSAGNGLLNNDNVNYDGYANQRYVIAATAIGPGGVQSAYAEPGAPILVAAYSSQTFSSSYVPTTDRSGTAGYTITGSPGGDYIPYFTGTSASAPAVSGAVALMLAVNPTLTWRDVQAILGYTARKNDASGGGWEVNGAGRNVSHKYGFGALDASAAVTMAQTWTNLAPEVSETSGTIAINQTIPDKPGGNGTPTPLTSSVTLNSLTHIEKVEVVFDATHAHRGDLRVELTSPDGTKSVLAEKHNDNNADYDQWVFTSTHHWDEIAKGTWTLTVTDQTTGSTGTLNSWKLNVYGTALTNVQYVQVTASNQTITGQDFFNQPPPSAKSSISFIFQTAPQKVTIVFDKDVTGQISADDLILHNDTLNQNLATSFAYNAATRTATYSYAPASGFAILPDGNYTATLKATGFGLSGGLHLDGNSDNLPDDDAIFTFFQLSGDADHDRTVNLNDLIRLANHYGTTTGLTWADGDFSGDGGGDLNDLIILANHYGSTLAAADTPTNDLSKYD